MANKPKIDVEFRVTGHDELAELAEQVGAATRKRETRLQRMVRTEAFKWFHLALNVASLVGVSVLVWFSWQTRARADEAVAEAADAIEQMVIAQEHELQALNALDRCNEARKP